MNLFGHHHHHDDNPWDGAQPRDIEIREMLRFIIERIDQMGIDTSKILAEVARERTELAGWKTLSAGKDKLIADAVAALKVATDALAASGVDTAALAKVQADLDQGASDLKNDNDEAAAAIAANVPPAAPPA